MLTTDGFSCSAISANDAAAGPEVVSFDGRRAETLGFVADCAGVGVSEPATISPNRNATVAARHTVTTRNRRAIGIIISGYGVPETNIRASSRPRVLRDQRLKPGLIQHGHAQGPRLVGLTARFFADDDGRH